MIKDAYEDYVCHTLVRNQSPPRVWRSKIPSRLLLSIENSPRSNRSLCYTIRILTVLTPLTLTLYHGLSYVITLL
eukprot:gene26184-biopygen14674